MYTSPSTMMTIPPIRSSRSRYWTKKTPTVPASRKRVRNTALKPAMNRAAPATMRLRRRASSRATPLT
jgi:hypothetical protein